MNILLSFAPFIAFALVDRLIGSTEGLIAGAAVSAALIMRDYFGAGKSPKVLEVGTVVLFVGLAAYTVIAEPGWSVMGVRLRVDAGLLLIVLISMAIGKPFTVQYARESVAAEYWDSPVFLKTNYIITAVWALAFVIMVIADLLLVYAPEVSPRVGVIATVLALIGAVKFTSWYPDRDKSSAAG